MKAQKKYIVKPYDCYGKRTKLYKIVQGVCHPGQCDADAKQAADQIEVKDKKFLISYLKEFGAWTEEELQNHQDNLERLVWIASGNFNDESDFYFG